MMYHWQAGVAFCDFPGGGSIPVFLRRLGVLTPSLPLDPRMCLVERKLSATETNWDIETLQAASSDSLQDININLFT